MIWKAFAGLVALSLATGANAQADPLTIRIDDSAARRFADLWRGTNGKPTAADVQRTYLDYGGRGIEVFMRGRIENADHLAQVIAAKPQIYADAVNRCLPWVPGTNAQLRTTYQGLKKLLPDHRLPLIAVVVGANNSGGTAASGIQVIGLEVICRLSPTRAAFDDHVREFFAHETVHTFQPNLSDAAKRNLLLASALVEGVPDYVTEVVTGEVPDPKRDAWARQRERWIWQQFLIDAAIVKRGTDARDKVSPEAQEAYHRWFGNAGSAPDGLPDELGYWVGMRIAEQYMARSADKHAALNELIQARDPAEILKKSGYGAFP